MRSSSRLFKAGLQCQRQEMAKKAFRCLCPIRGPGVPPDEKEKIFAKFYRIAEVNGENSKGTGLGLAISKALVELHGGKIWVESEASRRQHVLLYVAFIGATEFTIVLMRIAFSKLTVIRHSFGVNSIAPRGTRVGEGVRRR